MPNVYQEGGATVSGVANIFDLDGQQVVLSPDVTLTLLASYRFDSRRRRLLAALHIHVLLRQLPHGRLPLVLRHAGSRFTKTDISVTWRDLSGDWSVRAFINNLEDEAVLMNSTRFGGDLAITDYGAPRHWGLTLSYRY